MSLLTVFQNLFAPPRDLILIIAAAWIGLTFSERRAARYRVNLDSLSNLLMVSVVAFIVGGRLLDAFENLDIFLQSPTSIFSLNTSLFDLWGGWVIAVIVAVVYGRRVHLPFWQSLDALTPFFATLAIGIAFSHLASGEAFGKETTVPWAIDQWNATRHPTQVYEIIASFLTLILILFQKPDSKPGYEFLLFLALTSASRLVIEGFRGDSTLIFGGLRAAQVVAWLILLTALVVMEYRRTIETKRE
jgi:phosphatidylglycerol:prolipoprotein diacylglycerol transferase